MKDSKFTKIIKWAKENNYEVTDEISNYLGKYQVIIKVGSIRFTVENKESTIYYSIHGMKGDPKGIRLETQVLEEGKYKRPFSFIYKTQSEVIREMENDIKNKGI